MVLFRRGTINADSVDKDSKLIATYNNINELSRTFNLLDDSEYVRNAIRAIFKYASDVIYEPPLIYLKKLYDPYFSYDIKSNHGSILEFTQLIANGHDIEESKKEDYKTHCQARHDGLQEASDFWNAEAEKIRERIKDKKKHRKENSIPLNRELVSLMVASMTKGNGILDDFDWSRIELFESTLKVFFNDLELSPMKIQPNDWFDLLQLIYV